MTPWINDTALYFAGGHHYNRIGMLQFAHATIDALLPIANVTPYCAPGEACSISSSSFSSWISSSSSAISSSINASSASSSSQALEAFTVTEPDSGRTYAVGDTIHLRWNATNGITDAYPDISLDAGRTWIGIGFITSIMPTDDAWSNVHWVIPDSLSGKDLKIRLTTYVENGPKAIIPIHVQEAASIGKIRDAGIRFQLDSYTLRVQANRNWRFEICNLTGTPLLARKGRAGNTELSLASLPPGAYLLKSSWGHSLMILHR